MCYYTYKNKRHPTDHEREENTMKHTEIEAIFTAKVAEFISNGYTINATTMAGSQGEIAKIDFRKGNEIIRVMLATDTEWTDNGTRDMVKFTVGRSTENLANDNRPFDTMGITFWNNRMEIIEERRFYRIDNRANFYTEDVVEYDEMRRKQYQRYRNRDDRRGRKELPEAARKIVKSLIKRKTGKSRVSSKEIKVIKMEATKTDRPVYYAEYHGKTYKIA